MPHRFLRAPTLCRKRSISLALTFFFAALICSHADGVDAYVKNQMRRQHVVGLSLAVVKDGRVIKAQGYGLANAELNVPATKETVYNIASVGKQFTATAIMMLVEEGKVGLDDRITNYLSYLPPAWSAITIRQLLTHTSGIQDYPSLPDIGKMEKSAVTTEQLVKMLADYPLQFRPGEQWKYCNIGYHLLAEIIAKVSHQPFPDFLKERIFEPLGMDSTSFYDWQSIITNRASPYSWRNGRWRNADYIDYSWAFGAGAEASTVMDMAKWDASLYTEKLLPKKRWEEMWTAVRLNDGKTFPYGFGWHVQTEPGDTGRVIWHGGSDPGNLSAVFHWIDDRITVIVFLTAGAEWLPNGQESSADIAMGVSVRYIPRLFDKPIGDTSPQLTARMKADLERLISGSLDGAEISPQWSGRKLPDIKQWVLQLSDLGKMKTFVPIWRDEAARNYGYRAVFPKESVRFGVSLDENGKLSSIDLGFE